MAAEHNRGRQEADAVGAGEDEAVAVRAPPLAPESSECFDHAGDQVDVSTLPVFRRPERAARAAPANSHNRLLEIDIAPAKCEQLPLPHSGFKRDQTQRPVGLVVEVAEKARQLVVLEVRGLLPLGPRSLRRRQLPHRIRFGISVENGSLQAGSQDAEMFRPS